MLKKCCCYFIVSFFMLCVFSEAAISGKSSSALAEEIYGKDLIEFTASYKENEYTFIKVEDGKFLVIKSKKNSGSEYEVSIFAAVEEIAKDEARGLVLELYEKLTPEGDAHCAVFDYPIFRGKKTYYIIVDGKLYMTYAIIHDISAVSSNGQYGVEYAAKSKDDSEKLDNLIEKWNLYQEKIQDQKNDDFLKSLGF